MLVAILEPIMRACSRVALCCATSSLPPFIRCAVVPAAQGAATDQDIRRIFVIFGTGVDWTAPVR